MSAIHRFHDKVTVYLTGNDVDGVENFGNETIYLKKQDAVELAKAILDVAGDIEKYPNFKDTQIILAQNV